MRIKICNDISKKYQTCYQEQLQKVEGRWVDVDTTYLFTTQFNTLPISGVSESGLRIYLVDVAKIENDERIGRSRCGYCGLWATTGDQCASCTSGTSSMVEFFRGTTRVSNMQNEVSEILDDMMK